MIPYLSFRKTKVLNLKFFLVGVPPIRTLRKKLRILESEMIFKLQVTTWHKLSHDSGVLAWMSRSETSLWKLNTVSNGLIILIKIIGGSKFWKYEIRLNKRKMQENSEMKII